MAYLRVNQQLTVRHTRKADYLITLHDIFEVDAAALAIFALADGRHTKEQIVTELAKKFACSPSEVIGALDPFVESMEKQGVLGWREQATPIRHPLYQPDSPSSITIEITNACNERCVYCINRAGRRLHNELSDEEINRLLDEIIELEVTPVNISGGEPLLRRALALQMISRLSEAGLEPFLLTNATLVTPELAAALYNAGLRSAQASIDSLEADLYEQHRGRPKALPLAVRGMRALQQAGIKVTAAVVITPRNYPYVQEIYDWIAKEGYMPKIGKVEPIGRGTDPDLLLSPAQVLGLQKFLSTGPDGRIGLNIVCRETCSIGTSPVVSPRGEIYPCYLARIPALRLGNVREQSLSEIWATSPLLKELMNWNVDQIEGCRDCWNKLYCGGGCRGRAHFYHGTIYANDRYHCAANQAMARAILHQGVPATQAALEELIVLAGHREQLAALKKSDFQGVAG